MSLIRRPGARFNRGRIPERQGAVQQTPLTILGSLAWWVRADPGITTGTGVSAWADQSGNGVNFTQGTGSAQPAFVAGAINGKPTVLFDSVDDVMSASWARSAPGTQPFYIWFVARQVTWIASRGLLGDYAAGPEGFIVQGVTGAPNLAQFAGANVNQNTAASLNTFFRFEEYFSNSAASYQKIGSTEVSGGNPGNAVGGGTLQLGAYGNSSSRSNVEFAEAFAFLGAPTASQRAALDAYCTSRYGAGLV